MCLEEGDLSVYGRGDEGLHVAPPKKWKQTERTVQVIDFTLRFLSACFPVPCLAVSDSALRICGLLKDVGACLCELVLYFCQLFLKLVDCCGIYLLERLDSICETLYLCVINREAVDGVKY